MKIGVKLLLFGIFMRLISTDDSLLFEWKDLKNNICVILKLADFSFQVKYRNKDRKMVEI